MKKIISFLYKRDVRTTIMMLLGTTIFTTSLIWVVTLGGFYTSGVTGISQIISLALEKVGINISISYFVVLINIPLFLIGWKSISKRFAIFSVFAVLYQSILILVLEALVRNGFQPFIALQNDRLTLALLGGFLGGIGSGIVLRGGASGG
ncbi:MAG: YitT family protein, partial [Bacilli bacterium]|nr:YitT family protein [Bacilli bacterium]